MDDKITTSSTLWNLVGLDESDLKLKDITILFLNAMNDWPTYNQTSIVNFIMEIKEYFGTPLTIEKIDRKKLKIDNDNSVWRHEAGGSIAELMNLSIAFYNQPDFDKIVDHILDHYNIEFAKNDFIAELRYLTTEQGGRKTPAKTDNRPQIKFDFTDMQTSGQQTFINKEIVNPGDNVEAKIKIVSPNYFAESLTVGMKFEFREGATIIGTGEIKYIVNDKLEKHIG